MFAKKHFSETTQMPKKYLLALPGFKELVDALEESEHITEVDMNVALDHFIAEIRRIPGQSVRLGKRGLFEEKSIKDVKYAIINSAVILDGWARQEFKNAFLIAGLEAPDHIFPEIEVFAKYGRVKWWYQGRDEISDPSKYIDPMDNEIV